MDKAIFQEISETLLVIHKQGLLEGVRLLELDFEKHSFRKIFFLLAFFSFLINPFCLLTAKPLTHWEFSGWYGGGCYPAVIVDPNIKGRLYLLSDVAGLWRSDNGGDKWYFVNEGIVNLKTAFLAISPSDSNTLYLGTKVGVMKSTDAGKTWHYLESTKEKFVFENNNGR